jgi:iron-sulfur cluster assembly protein
MLTLTQDATEAIEQILESPEVPDGAGIRIAAGGPSTNGASADAGTLQITVVTGPGGEDEVIEDAGARVFVDETLATFLADKTLDVVVQDQQVQFSLETQS